MEGAAKTGWGREVEAATADKTIVAPLHAAFLRDGCERWVGWYDCQTFKLQAPEPAFAQVPGLSCPFGLD